jgi:ribonucleoside-diphosphate reductase alpha chain
MKAVDLFTLFMSERKNTGRVYWMNVDHANTHGAYVEHLAPIRQSNLCAEILEPTWPLQSVEGGAKKVVLKVPKNKVEEFKLWRKQWKNIIPKLP